jgi:hypothetical protein
VGGWGFDDDEPDPSVARAAANGIAQTRRLRELIVETLSDIAQF